MATPRNARPEPGAGPHLGEYRSTVEAWHENRCAVCEELIVQHLAENQRGAFLAWGDPSLYDSILRVMHALSRRASFPFEYEVIPGITSVQVLAAEHRIPVNQIGQAVQITTGRRLGERLRPGLPSMTMSW
jgi:precorrin-6A synthase